MIGQRLLGCRVDKNLYDTTINHSHAGFCAMPILGFCAPGWMGINAEGGVTRSSMHWTPEGCWRERSGGAGIVRDQVYINASPPAQQSTRQMLVLRFCPL